MTTETEGNLTDDGLDGLENLSGYSDSDEYLATRFKQGGRDVYCVDLSVPQLVATLPKPDHTRQLDGNRKIGLPHAKAFAKYVREKKNWIIPPLLLRAAEGTFEFESKKRIGGTEWGVLTLPRLARNDLKIVDGQHRILGFHLASEEQTDERDVARGKLATMKRQDDAPEKRQQQNRVSTIDLERKRLAAERVAVQIVIVDADEEYKQMFVDIANNAKGISQSVRDRFDSRQIVNRCLDAVMEHDLLKDRVDIDRDNVSGKRNSNLTSVKSVADIVRTVQVGVSGRISPKREDELDETKLIDDARLFLDTLLEGFAEFAAVATGSLAPAELRARSLLGSVTMHRVLAGVYHDLLINPLNNQVLPQRDAHDPDRIRVGRQRSRAEVVRFFQSLAPHMAAPVEAGSVWVKDTQQFSPGDSAPPARAKDRKELTMTVRNWAITPPKWLKP